MSNHRISQMAPARAAQHLNTLANFGENTGEDERQRAHDQVRLSTKKYECICGDILEGTSAISLPCGHVRCKECLNENVRVGLRNHRSFPPRCCYGSRIDVDKILPYLEDQLVGRWTQVRDEYLDRNPMYCGRKECSSYIARTPLSNGDRLATCLKCNAKTCSNCGNLEADHTSDAECPDQIDAQNKTLIEEKGWKPCPRCRQMIERVAGCSIMICHCGTSFCYKCGTCRVKGICDCYKIQQRNEELERGNQFVPEQRGSNFLQGDRAGDRLVNVDPETNGDTESEESASDMEEEEDAELGESDSDMEEDAESEGSGSEMDLSGPEDDEDDVSDDTEEGSVDRGEGEESDESSSSSSSGSDADYESDSMEIDNV